MDFENQCTNIFLLLLKKSSNIRLSRSKVGQIANDWKWIGIQSVFGNLKLDSRLCFCLSSFIKVTPVEAEFAAAEPGVQGRAAMKLKAFFPPPELGESKVYD